MPEVPKTGEVKKECRRDRYAFARQVSLNQALLEGGDYYLEELEALPEPSKIKCDCPKCTPKENNDGNQEQAR